MVELNPFFLEDFATEAYWLNACTQSEKARKKSTLQVHDYLQKALYFQLKSAYYFYLQPLTNQIENLGNNPV